MKKFIQKLRHAFTIEEDKFTEEELQMLDSIAKEVVRRRLETPAILFLESVRPLNFLGNQLMVFFEPVVSVVVPTHKYNQLARILERRSSINILMEKIEAAINAKENKQ